MSPPRASVIAVVAAMLVALPACSSSGSPGGAADVGTSGPEPVSSADPTATPSEIIATAPALASIAPPSEGCAAMDAALASLLTQSEPGRAFTQAVESRGNSQDQWLALVAYLGGDGRTQLAAAASGDVEAEGALTALDTYTRLAPGVLGGKIEQFVDPQKAQDDLGAGREPEIRPEYTEAVEQVTRAYVVISQCMPSWPVVF